MVNGPGRPYHDPDYRAMRAALALTATPCWFGCGRRATSPDHVPPLSQHDHRRGANCCQLRPACLPCQLEQGRRLAARHHPAATASRRW